MRQKFVSSTYMRGVTDWEIIMIKNSTHDYYLTIKRINKIEEPFILHQGDEHIVLINNGYYIIEYTPTEQHYNARVYINNRLEVVEYYFDLSRSNGIMSGIPYYEDMYLDLIYNARKEIIIDDEDELIAAMDAGEITAEEYKNTKESSFALIQEIKEGRNQFINMDKIALIKKYFLNTEPQIAL